VRRCPNLDTLISYTYRTLKVDEVYEIIYLAAKSVVYKDRLPPKYDYRPYWPKSGSLEPPLKIDFSGAF
jgi:hypothetical protein